MSFFEKIFKLDGKQARVRRWSVEVEPDELIKALDNAKRALEQAKAIEEAQWDGFIKTAITPWFWHKSTIG